MALQTIVARNVDPLQTAVVTVGAFQAGTVSNIIPAQAVLRLSVRALVRLLEHAVIDLLDRYGIRAANRADAPGVYVQGAKVAALGLRVRKGRCYHGVALNVDMDLAPFLVIDPCGYTGMPVTCLRDLNVSASQEAIGEELLDTMVALLMERVVPAGAATSLRARGLTRT